MQKIVITKIIIDNFRGIKHFDKELSENLNIVQGYNGVGKTTVLSAITWCLFGKLYDERKSNIPLLPIYSHDIEQKVVASVVVYLNNKHLVKRIYDGNKTTLYYGMVLENGEEEILETTINDFNNFFEQNYFDIETFKSVSNLSYAVNLHWKDLKKLVFGIIGEVTPEDVFKIKDLPSVFNQVKLFGFDTFEEKNENDIKETILNIKNKEITINSLNQMKIKYIGETSNDEALVERQKDLNAQLISYEDKMLENKERQNVIDELNKEYEEKCLLVKSYSNDLVETEALIFEYSNLYAGERETGKQKKAQMLIDQKNVLNEIEKELILLDGRIQVKAEQIDNIKLEGNALKKQEIKITNNCCNTCGQPLPKDVVEKALKKLKLEQEDKLVDLKNNYDLAKKEYNALCNEKAKIKLRYDEEFATLEKIRCTDASTMADEYEENQTLTLKAKELREKKIKLENSIKLINKEIDEIKEKVAQAPIPDVLPSISLIYSELEEINKKLASLTALKELEEDIAKEEQELLNLKSDLMVLQEKQRDLEEYNAIYSEIVKSKIKKRFKVVEFITNEYTKEGKRVETFKIAKDNIPFQELNTAMKIEVALDLLNSIQTSKDIKVPILIDNCESILELPVVGTQMIIAKCIEQQEKKLEIIEGDMYGKESR